MSTYEDTEAAEENVGLSVKEPFVIKERGQNTNHKCPKPVGDRGNTCGFVIANLTYVQPNDWTRAKREGTNEKNAQG